MGNYFGITDEITSSHVELDLDDIFDINGYIDGKFKYCCRDNSIVKTIKIIRTKTTPIKIGDNFLRNFKNLRSIDSDKVSNVVQVGSYFLTSCMKLETIDLSFLSNVTQINIYFLSGCWNLHTIDLSPLKNITRINDFFLTNCSNLIAIDLSPLVNVTRIENYFLASCSDLISLDLRNLWKIKFVGKFFLFCCENLAEIFTDDGTKINSEIVKTRFYKLIKNFEFTNYNNDIEKINSDKLFTKSLFFWLDIDYKNENHEQLIEILAEMKKKYNSKMTDEEIKKTCVNFDDLFTLDNLHNIPKGQLIFLNGIDEKYYCFDAFGLKQLISTFKSNDCKNPYTGVNFSQIDMNKISKIDIKKIKYFCDEC